ncbi:hypothetical protein ACFLW1_02115 [Chloroflexota bacterium]
MVNEISDYGDGKMIVLYTDDNAVYRNLKDFKKVINHRFYYQEQNRRSITVGCDLYFEKKHRRWLERKIDSLDPYFKGDF